MLYKIKNSYIFVVLSYTIRYDYAYTEVRGEFVCNGSQATDQDCKVWKISSTNHPEGEYPSCRGQEWEETHDCPGSRHCVQHIRHDSAECANQLWREGTRSNSSAEEKGNAPVEAKVTGEVEAHIIALACGDPPKGYAKWTLRLLADKSVKLGYIGSISHTQVGRILKKTSISLI